MSKVDENGSGAGNASLKAVLFLDLVGSSRLMSEHESATVAFLERCFTVFRTRSRHHRGELVKTTGDGALIVFVSATDAIEFAMEMHRTISEMEADFSNTAAFRVGIHLGEVQYRRGDVYGHAVNVAARLESLADSGSTCISKEVYTLVQRTSRFDFEALGGHRLRNIPEHMRVYRVVDGNLEKVQPVHENPFSISTIGGLRIARLGSAIEFRGRVHVKGVLGYLCLSSDGFESIGRLVALLWPGRKSADARRAISRLVHNLEAGIGVPVKREDGMIKLGFEDVTVDLLRLEQELRLGHVDPVLIRNSDWPDRILAGLEEIGPLFTSWLSVVRTDWRIRIASSLELCLDLFELADDGTRDAATALVRIEPGHERAARTLIRHYHAVDNPGAATRVYNQLVAHLDSRFGISPKPETTKAARGVDANLVEPSVRRSGAPLRIHVAKFDAEQHTERESTVGFRNELLASLASFRGWSVVECDQRSNPSDHMSDYILDGEMSGSSASPEISLTLSDGIGGRIVWSDRYDLNPQGFQAAKRRALGRIAATLEVYISTDRVSAGSPDPSHTAVDAWLQAERVFSRWTPKDHDAAAAILEKLILKESEFAPAYASLASIQNVSHIVRPGRSRDAIATRRAYALADRAAEIDPLDARNQLAVAWSASLEGDFDKASVHMDMAARLNPNSPRTLVSCSMAFAFLGNHERAHELLKHSLDCAPILLDYQWCYAGSVYYLAGDYQRALAAINRGRDKIIDNHGWRAATLARLGRMVEAQAVFAQQVKAVSPIWCGAKPPTDRAVFEWFVNVYPFRRSKERKALADALLQLLPSADKPIA